MEDLYSIFEDDNYFCDEDEEYQFEPEPQGSMDIEERDREMELPTPTLFDEGIVNSNEQSISSLSENDSRNPWTELKSLGVDFFHTKDNDEPNLNRILFRFDRYEMRLYCEDNNISYETPSHPFSNSQRVIIPKHGRKRFNQKLGTHMKQNPSGAYVCGYTKYILISSNGFYKSRKQDMNCAYDINAKVYLDFNDAVRFTTLSYNHSRVCDLMYEVIHFEYSNIQNNARKHVRIVNTKQKPWNFVNCKFESRGTSPRSMTSYENRLDAYKFLRSKARVLSVDTIEEEERKISFFLIKLLESKRMNGRGSPYNIFKHMREIELKELKKNMRIIWKIIRMIVNQRNQLC